MIKYVNNHRIEVYDSAKSLPILRFQLFNKYMMMASEVGSTFADYDARTARTLQFLQKNMVAEAIQELNNRRQAVFNAYNEYSPKGKAFAVMVKKIDDRTYEGTSPDELDEVLRHLDQIGLGHIDSMETLTEVKKKSRRNFKFTIPTIFRRTRTQT